MFLSPARKVRKRIGGLWRQRCVRKEAQVEERQLYVPINDEGNLDSKTDLLCRYNPREYKNQTTSQVQYTKSAKYGSASVQLGEAPALQKDPPTGTAEY